MNRASGFTIIELLTAVTIGGVLLAVALPSYDNLMRNNCMTTTANSLVSSLQLARSEATKRHKSVTITAANGGDDANEWGTGWTVWQDADADGTLDSGEEIRVTSLTCQQPANGENNMTVDETGDHTSFTYSASGFVDNTANIQICHAKKEGERGRDITISNTGRPSTEPDFSGCL